MQQYGDGNKVSHTDTVPEQLIASESSERASNKKKQRVETNLKQKATSDIDTSLRLSLKHTKN